MISKDIRIISACNQEWEGQTHCDNLSFSGVGKVNATIHTMKIIRVHKPNGVVTAQVGSQDKRPKQVENWKNVFNKNFGNATLDRVYIPSFDSSWNFYSSVNH